MEKHSPWGTQHGDPAGRTLGSVTKLALPVTHPAQQPSVPRTLWNWDHHWFYLGDIKMQGSEDMLLHRTLRKVFFSSQPKSSLSLISVMAECHWSCRSDLHPKLWLLGALNVPNVCCFSPCEIWFPTLHQTPGDGVGSPKDRQRTNAKL
jgi:hypothetical protein